MRKLALALLATALLAPAALGASSGPTVLSRSDIGDVFDPTKVKVDVGTTVHWHNESGKHNVVFNRSGKRLGGDPATHEPTADHWNAQFTFNTAGWFHYYCSEHSDGHFGMVGQVQVADPNAPAPKITNLHAKPAKFCTNRSKNCDKPGTKLQFTLSQESQVTGYVKPEGGKWKRIFKNKVREKGKNSIRYSGSGLKPGKYVFKLRARNPAGKKSPAATTNATVVG